MTNKRKTNIRMLDCCSFASYIFDFMVQTLNNFYCRGPQEDDSVGKSEATPETKVSGRILRVPERDRVPIRIPTNKFEYRSRKGEEGQKREDQEH